ncbi:hypothetical protein NQ317_005315 [Molorchus minor]|uniref:Uncharacterized protein n=1 Tax=Molorchus minor TaxID=1323400 RepID=A0ABQ9JXZ3_9CUCU|nr:hypothetical protein NQ317_005315 [Molorchus minor]
MAGKPKPSQSPSEASKTRREITREDSRFIFIDLDNACILKTVAKCTIVVGLEIFSSLYRNTVP